MRFSETEMDGLIVVEMEPTDDERGWFSRSYCRNEFEQQGVDLTIAQMNHSFNTHKGTLRGMHYQLPPFGETKVVRCIAGAVFDVAIDLRISSPTFLQWKGVELSVANRQALIIPKGFAHGFLTLENRSELIYLHSEFYSPGSEAAVHYMDPKIGINWPEPITTVSDKDRNHPYLEESFKGI